MMTLSEKMALDALYNLDFDLEDRKSLINDIGFILTVARDCDNWDLIEDFLSKGFSYIRRK